MSVIFGADFFYLSFSCLT